MSRILIFGTILLLAGCDCPKHPTFGRVTNKEFIPEHTALTTEMVLNADGDLTPRLTTETIDDAWYVTIESLVGEPKCKDRFLTNTFEIPQTTYGQINVNEYYEKNATQSLKECPKEKES